MGAWVHGADGQIMCLCTCQLERRKLIRYNINEVIAYKAIGGGVKIVGYVLLLILNI